VVLMALALPAPPAGQFNQALGFQLVEIAHQVQWNSMLDAEQGASRRRSDSPATTDISGIAAPLHTLIANILGRRKLAGGFTAKDIQVTEAFVLKYECMGALKEYQWDAKGNIPAAIF
jgi:hypothetical protein